MKPGQSTDVLERVASYERPVKNSLSFRSHGKSYQIALAVSEGSSSHASSHSSLQGDGTALLARRVLAPKSAVNARLNQHLIIWIWAGNSDYY